MLYLASMATSHLGFIAAPVGRFVIRDFRYAVISSSQKPSHRIARRALCSTVAQRHNERKAPPDEVKEFVTSADEDGERVDKVLAARLSRSRSYFHTLLADDAVSINGTSSDLSKARRLRIGERVRVVMRVPEREQPLQPEAIPLVVLYEDEHLAIIDKPAGLVVHPAPGNWSGTLVHALAHRYGIQDSNNPDRPGIVHRLDKGTSGVMVVARHRVAHDALAELFAERAVDKDYLAITVGSPAASGAHAGVIDAPISRDRANRLRMSIVPENEGGRPARSTYQVLTRDNRGFLHVVHVRIHTGRTHQVRVHMRHCRAPVLGDDMYGAPDINRRFRAFANRPLLHSRSIAFDHPITHNRISVCAKLPPDFRSVISARIDPKLLERFPDW